MTLYMSLSYALFFPWWTLDEDAFDTGRFFGIIFGFPLLWILNRSTLVALLCTSLGFAKRWHRYLDNLECTCPRCTQVTAAEGLFCLHCGERLHPSSLKHQFFNLVLYPAFVLSVPSSTVGCTLLCFPYPGEILELIHAVTSGLPNVVTTPTRLVYEIAAILIVSRLYWLFLWQLRKVHIRPAYTLGAAHSAVRSRTT